MKRIVGAALCYEGKVLLCLEAVTHSPGQLYWFPTGGKVEPGESDEEAIRRELEEELGITTVMLAENYVTLRPYRGEHQGDWFGTTMIVRHFVADLDVPLPFKLLVGQRSARWVSAPPADGLISQFTKALMINLLLDGYLRQ